MIVWREKIVATTIHFFVTLVLAAIAAALIFLVWYPDPFHEMIGGSELFVLIIGSDLALGPLMSLVIYNSRKSRRELLLDYSILGVVQIAALVYGVSIMAGARPVYVVFNADRFEVVLASDLREKELAQAKDPQLAKVPWYGIRYAAVSMTDKERQDELFESLAGNEEHRRPKFFVPLESYVPQIVKRAQPLPALEKKLPGGKSALDAALRNVDVPAERLAWLPVRHLRGFWTAIIDTSTGKPVTYIDLDPY
jgi:hypothetical protein